MGWFRGRGSDNSPRELGSERARLVDGFVETYARLRRTVDEYKELHGALVADGVEVEYEGAIAIAEEEILDVAVYRMLSYGSPSDQLAQVSQVVERWGSPLTAPPERKVWCDAFDYEHAYDELPDSVRAGALERGAYDEYIALVCTFRNDYVLRTYQETYDEGPDAEERRDSFSDSHYRRARRLARRHAAEGVSDYRDEIMAHTVEFTSAEGYARLEFDGRWRDEDEDRRSHVRGNWAARRWLERETADHRRRLALLESIFDDSLAHLRTMARETEEATSMSVVALDRLHEHRRRCEEDREYEALGESGERQAMLEAIHRVVPRESS